MGWVLKLVHPKLLYTSTELSLGLLLPSFLHVILCFVLLGITASEYLCPNVAKLTDSGSGGTGALMAVLLSWCNSSPDLFSNLMSWTSTESFSDSSNAAALSIGEVLGACGIILCIVIGSIFVIMASTPIDFTNHQRKMILGDLGFVLLGILLMTYICIRDRVTVLNCLVMITVYIAFLVVKFTCKGSVGGEEDSFARNTEEQLTANRIKPSIISAMDINNLLSILENSKDFEENEQAELVSMNYGDSQMDLSFADIVRPATEPLKDSERTQVSSAPQTSPVAFQPYLDDPERNPRSSATQQIVVRPSNVKARFKKVKQGLLQVFIPHLLNFRKKSLVDAILSILTVPFVVLLRLSCPQPLSILDYDKSKSRYDITSNAVILLLIQSIFCPIFTLLILSCIIERQFSLVYWILTMSISTALVAFILSFYKSLLSFNSFSLVEPSAEMMLEDEFTAEETVEERRMIERLGSLIEITFLSMGIINAILWISLLANTLIEMLDIYQRITHISQGILGLTVFAWGNSISDLISNIAMCRLYQKMPRNDLVDVKRMATKFFIVSCTSCLGGVLLNSMGGIGISGLIAMSFVHKSSNKWWFLRSVVLKGDEAHFDYKFLVSCFVLVLQILFLAIFFGSPSPLHNWFKKRIGMIGLGMCCLWGMATLCNVFLEIFL